MIEGKKSSDLVDTKRQQKIPTDVRWRTVKQGVKWFIKEGVGEVVGMGCEEEQAM